MQLSGGNELIGEESKIHITNHDFHGLHPPRSVGYSLPGPPQKAVAFGHPTACNKYKVCIGLSQAAKLTV
jgi:hypothetical protein